MDTDVELGRTHLVADAIRRWFAIMIVAGVVVGGVAAYFAAHRAADYSSTAKVLLEPAVGNPFAPSTSSTQQVMVAMQTEAGNVSSPAVTRLVNRQLHTALPAASRDVVSSVPNNTQVVEIIVTAKSPSTAQRIASSFAVNFLAYRASQAQSSQSHQLSVLDEQLKSAQLSLKAAAQSAKGSRAPADASAQLQVYTNRVASIQESIGQLQSAAISAGSLMAPATLPKSPTGLPSWVLVTAAAMCGLLVGFVVALWLERRDNRVRLSTAVAVNGIPLLTDLTPRRGRHAATASMDERARTGCVALAALSQPPSIVGFAAPAVIQGSVSAVVDAIGHGLARSGYRVTLVDTTQAPEPSPINAKTYEIGDLDALLRDGSSPESRAGASGVRRVRISTASAESRDTLAGPEFAALVERLGHDADYVLVACGPLNTAAGSAVARVTDTLIVCVVDRVTTHQQVTDAARRAAHLGIATLGCVGVGPVTKRPSRNADAASESNPTPRRLAEKTSQDDSHAPQQCDDEKVLGAVRPS